MNIAAYWFLVHSSVANLCILTWDRYTAIVLPLKNITFIVVRRAGRMILLAWLIPLLIDIALPLFLGMFVSSSPTLSKVLRLTVGSITSRCSGKWARTHQNRTRETAEIEPSLILCLRFWHIVFSSPYLCWCPYSSRSSQAITAEFCNGVSQEGTLTGALTTGSSPWKT